MTKLRKWKLSDIGKGLVNAFLAILQGKLLLKLNATRYFIHILYTFFIFWISIWRISTFSASSTCAFKEIRSSSMLVIIRLTMLSTLASISRTYLIRKRVFNTLMAKTFLP